MLNSLRAVTVAIIIVGADHTELSMATQLQQCGIPSMIIEKNEHIAPLSKAVIV